MFSWRVILEDVILKDVILEDVILEDMILEHYWGIKKNYAPGGCAPEIGKLRNAIFSDLR